MLVLPCVISDVCFRNDLFFFTSPELFCTLLLRLPEGIFFLQGGVMRDFSIGTAELLSQVPPLSQVSKPLGLTQPAGTSVGGIRGAS